MDLFAKRRAAGAPDWLDLPKDAREALVGLMTRLILEHVRDGEDPMRAIRGQGRVSLVCRMTSRRRKMSQFSESTQPALDYNSTIIGALELSEKKWVLAIQLPGVIHHSRHVMDAGGDELAAFIERLKARCAAAAVAPNPDAANMADEPVASSPQRGQLNP
jgi:hypothetical protein